MAEFYYRTNSHPQPLQSIQPMAYQVLARKYRPQLFSDVIGQDHVTRTLLNALAQGRIAHGYIFSGHRGIGKTTIARILAAALNCSTPVGTPERPTEEPCRVCVNCREISSASRQENSIFEESHSFDVEEIDAATNRGIDDARLLTTKIQTRPTNKSKYRIIILDEAHQITDAAWNALLKTLEEPPDWAVFMFATTQPEDIPQTIRSRCQHFSFHAVKLDDIVRQLRFISDREQIVVDDATLTLLAEAGDGSMRDALSIMDQAIASAPLVCEPGQTEGHPHLELEAVRALMGSVSNAVYEQILEAVHANNSADVLAIVGHMLDAGNGAPQLARQFVRYLRNAVVAKVTHLTPETPATGISADLLQISPEERARVARSAGLFTEEELTRFLSIVIRTFDELGYRQEQRFHLELGLLKLVHVQRLVPIEELLSQLGAKPNSSPKTMPTALSASSPGVLSSVQATSTGKTNAPFTRATDPVMTAPSSRPKELDAIRSNQRPAFEPESTRRTPVAVAAIPSEAGVPSTAGALALATEPHAPEAAPSAVLEAVRDVPQERPHLVLPREPAAITSAAPSTFPAHTDFDAAALQAAIVAALSATKGQQSAAEQIEDATVTIAGDTFRIQTTLSRTMLPVLINAETERILKATLRERNAGALKLELLPGAPAPAGPKKPRAAVSGSAAELAERHPLVQEARRIFAAEISNVIDLRDKS
jgi:DNA polymerase-3 subunit gamma/tau